MVGALAVVGVLVPAGDRGRVQSVIGVLMPVAIVGGPLLGGVLTDHLSWRWAFYVNLPVGLFALTAVAVGVRLPAVRRTEVRIDWAGAGLLTTGVLALTLIGSWGGTAYGWASPQVLGAAGAAALATALFVRVERRAVEPLIPPALFRHRAVTEALVLGFLLGALMLALIGYLPQYLQFVQGASPTAGGLLLLPLMLGMLGSQLATARLTARGGGRRYPLLGSAVALLGTLLLLTLGADTARPLASALTVVAGAGIGLVLQSTLLATMAAVPPRDMGAAMGSVMLFRTIGGSLGMAALGAVYTAGLSSSLTGALGPDAAGGLTDGGLTPAAVEHLPGRTADAVRAAVTTGLHGTLLGAAAVAAAAVAVAALARRSPDPDRDPAPDPASAELPSTDPAPESAGTG